MSKHTEGAGAAAAITGKNRDVLVRDVGYSKTCDALQSKVRSAYKGTEKHNLWEAPSCGWGDDNVKH